MNLASEGGDPSSGVFFVNFNQNVTSLAVGTKSGYKLFSLSHVEQLEQIYVNEEIKDVCIVERHFSSSLVAIVSLSSPRKLKVCHFKKGTEICNYSYSNTILAVKLNRLRLVVCLEESLYIHNLRDMKVLHTIRDTPPNPRGLCSLSINNDRCYLAYPGSSTIGEVQIFDANTLQTKLMIPAHDNPLAALAFDPNGTKLATASEKGTVIRVFGASDGQKLYEFRRGMKRCVNIYSLSFSEDSLFLCASSNTETVHIFKLENPKEIKPTEEPQGWIGYFGRALMNSASYLPSQVTEMFSQGRAFATVHLPFSGLKNVCALAVIQKSPRVLIASADGFLYIYNFDPVEGGDCTLIKQHRVDGCEDEKPATAISPNLPVSSGGDMTSSGKAAENPSYSGATSYAAAVRGSDTVSSSAVAEVITASPPKTKPVGNIGISETPPKSSLRLDDDNEFPPVTHKTE